MSGDNFPGSVRSHEQQTRKLFLCAGTAYGVIFGLSLALLTWGYDALVLASVAADLAWAKLLLGLPLAIAIAGLAGRLAASSSSTAVSVALWGAAGALLGILVGHMPFDGGNLATWLVDQRTRGLVVFPFGSSAAARTALITLIGAGLGVATGGLERMALGWAWDRATSSGRMSGRSYAVLLVCVPLTLIAAWAADDLVNRPLRLHQQTVGELMTLAAAGAGEEAEARGLNYASIALHSQRLSQQYTLYLAEYDLDTHEVAIVDTAFDNGFSLRCMTARGQVGYCGPASDVYQEWMDSLIQAGLHGPEEQPATLKHALTVDDTVMPWLETHKKRLSPTYELAKVAQRGGWVFMSARFDTGFEMVCRFRGAMSVTVDQCKETRLWSRP